MYIAGNMSTPQNHVHMDILHSNKFPAKLWRILNSCVSGAIGWGPTGHTIYVDHHKFQQEYLDSPNTHFKTTNIGSFIRQLNLYGFKKLNAPRYGSQTSNSGREIYEFHNDQFVRGRPDLVGKLTRNVGIRRSREAALKRRLQCITDNHSCGIHSIFQSKTTSRHTEQYPGSYGACNEVTPSGQLTNTQPGLPKCDSPIMNTTSSGQYPMYVQWDNGSYKYVVLPDGTKTKAPAAPVDYGSTSVVKPMLVPQETAAFPVIHVPDSSGSRQEYYVVTLLSDGTTIPPNKSFPWKTEIPKNPSNSEQPKNEFDESGFVRSTLQTVAPNSEIPGVTPEQTEAIFKLLTQQYPKLLNSAELVESSRSPSYASEGSTSTCSDSPVSAQLHASCFNKHGSPMVANDLWMSGNGYPDFQNYLKYQYNEEDIVPIDLSYRGLHGSTTPQPQPNRSATDTALKLESEVHVSRDVQEASLPPLACKTERPELPDIGGNCLMLFS